MNVSVYLLLWQARYQRTDKQQIFPKHQCPPCAESANKTAHSYKKIVHPVINWPARSKLRQVNYSEPINRSLSSSCPNMHYLSRERTCRRSSAVHPCRFHKLGNRHWYPGHMMPTVEKVAGVFVSSVVFCCTAGFWHPFSCLHTSLSSAARLSATKPPSLPNRVAFEFFSLLLVYLSFCHQ